MKHHPIPDSREWHLTTAAAKLAYAADCQRSGLTRDMFLNLAGEACLAAGEVALAAQIDDLVGGFNGAALTLAEIVGRVERLLREEIALVAREAL